MPRTEIPSPDGSSSGRELEPTLTAQNSLPYATEFHKHSELWKTVSLAQLQKKRVIRLAGKRVVQAGVDGQVRVNVDAMYRSVPSLTDMYLLMITV